MKDPYIYEDTGTLINKLGIKDYDELRQAEADLSFVKLLTVDRDVDCRKFDLKYLKDVHRYILEDIYDWAGEFRTVPMVKPEKILGGDSVRYSYPEEIDTKAQEYLHEINAINWNVMDIDEKSLKFSKLIAGVWQVHPFRDGNTRTMITYAFRFAEEHGFPMQRQLLLDSFEYVRGALVWASQDQYSNYDYLNKIVNDAIKREAKTRSEKNLNALHEDDGR